MRGMMGRMRRRRRGGEEALEGRIPDWNGGWGLGGRSGKNPVIYSRAGVWLTIETR